LAEIVHVVTYDSITVFLGVTTELIH